MASSLWLPAAPRQARSLRRRRQRKIPCRNRLHRSLPHRSPRRRNPQGRSRLHCSLGRRRRRHRVRRRLRHPPTTSPRNSRRWSSASRRWRPSSIRRLLRARQVPLGRRVPPAHRVLPARPGQPPRSPESRHLPAPRIGSHRPNRGPHRRLRPGPPVRPQHPPGSPEDRHLPGRRTGRSTHRPQRRERRLLTVSRRHPQARPARCRPGTARGRRLRTKAFSASRRRR
jgi:hypothetical protein